MAAVVGIHGIGQQFRGGYQLATAWFDAVRDGLDLAGFREVAAGLTAGDLRVSFFGDLFRPPGALAGQGPPYTAAHISSDAERDLLAVWYQAAVAQDESLGQPEGALGAGRASVQVMLAGLARWRAAARVAERAFIGDLKQVIAFLHDPHVKENVLDRLQAEMASDTRVLIGHSLGSVVAYEYLCRYQPPGVELLITAGSPLGIPNVVFDQLTPPPVIGTGTWPGAVASWVNVADPDDIVALRKDLAPLFPGPVGQQVSDRRVNNGNNPHAAEQYLNTRETGSALGDVLG